MTVARPQPDPADPLNAGYFAALAQHRLVVQRCATCQHLQWPARELCAGCHGGQLGWGDVEPRGEVYTYTVIRRAFDPWFARRVPYAVVVVALDGHDLRMVGNCFGEDVAAIACGVRVRAAFEDAGADGTLLLWTPA